MLIQKRSFCFLTLILVSQLIFSQSYDPVANPQSVVRSGNARFTILTDHVIRMEYSNDGTFTDQATLTFVNRNLPASSFTTSEASGWLTIKTQYCTLKYKSTGSFNENNLIVEYRDQRHKFIWRPGMTDTLNLKGATRTLDGAHGKYNDDGSPGVILEDGMLSRSGWTLIDDSERPLFDNSDWAWVQARKGGSVQDLYFFGYGSDYKAALFDFTQIAGKISLPPKFAFGVWYSRYWAYTEAQFKEIAAEYQRNNIPLDVLVIDMDWHLTGKSSPEIFMKYVPRPDGWTGFTWEKKYFPDYREFLAWTDTQRLQTCMNLHPASGVQQHEEAYPAFAKAMGMNPTGHKRIKFDIINKKFAQNYFDVLLHPYEKAGVDFWWLDWQQWGGTKIKGVNPTFYLNYVHFSDMQREGKRPLIFHRWGGLGNHRYEIGFSGDYKISWEGLDYQPEFTATGANVGFGYWSHDIGGHWGGSIEEKKDAELFTRWVEWGAFSPIFRTHATNDPEIDRRIYKYPEPNLKAMRKALQDRYALLPYIYSMARYAYDSAISIVHPMYYEYPDLNQCYHQEHQYYFGNDLIISPISRPMNGFEKISQAVWLPEGNWYDFRDGKMISGGKEVTGYYTLDEVPIYVRAGSIIPTQTPKLRITGSVLDTLILTVYSSDAGASFKLYEDEGNNENYRKDICSFTQFNYQKADGAVNFKIQPDGKTFPSQVTERCYEIRIIASDKPAQVKMNGKAIDWNYDEKTGMTLIKTPKEKIEELIIEVKM